jgi:hypothetical protein
MNDSLEILQDAEKYGKKPHRLPSANLDDPSYLAFAWTEYLSSYV